MSPGRKAGTSHQDWIRVVEKVPAPVLPSLSALIAMFIWGPNLVNSLLAGVKDPQTVAYFAAGILLLFAALVWIFIWSTILYLRTLLPIPEAPSGAAAVGDSTKIMVEIKKAAELE